MDLTSLPQKSTKWLVMFAVITLLGIREPVCTHADSSSTLVFVTTSDNASEDKPESAPKDLNTLRPESTISADEQNSDQPINTLRKGNHVQANQTIGSKTRPAQAIAQHPTVIANSKQTNKKPTSALKIRQPNRIVRVVKHSTTDNRSTPRRSLKTNSSVQVAQHQEEIALAAEIDPIKQILLRANQLSQRAAKEQDYTKIVSLCANAIRRGASDEHRRFARQLASWALNRRGQLRLDSEEVDLADADFRTALDYNPNNWRARHNQGVSFAQNGQFEEAFEDFNQVISLNPQFAKAYANRATLYFQNGDYHAAKLDYQRALDRDSDLPAARVGISRTCHLLGRWDEALEHFNQAIKLNPTNATTICSRGDLLSDMGRYREALADYARTIELNPEFAHAYRNGAWLLATCPDSEYRDAENAIRGAEQALEYNYGERHAALDTLAAALANAGRFDEAIAKLKEAMQIAPSEAKLAYRTRMQMYRDRQPFRTQPVGEIAQATYEISDR